LRIHCPDILPQYFALALQVKGEYEKFSRSNHTSTQRIKSLTIQVPDLSIQKEIPDMLNKYAEDLHFDKMNVSDIDKKSHKILVDYIRDVCKKISPFLSDLRFPYEFTHHTGSNAAGARIAPQRKSIEYNYKN